MRRTIAAGGSTTLRLRLRDAHDGVPFERFDAKLQDARDAADAFYNRYANDLLPHLRTRLVAPQFTGTTSCTC